MSIAHIVMCYTNVLFTYSKSCPSRDTNTIKPKRSCVSMYIDHANENKSAIMLRNVMITIGNMKHGAGNLTNVKYRGILSDYTGDSSVYMFTVKRLRTALSSAIAVFSFANYAKSSVLNSLVNKAIDDRRLRPGATYRATVNNLLRSRGRVQACICIWHVHYVKHDVIHKPDVHSMYHCHQRRTELRPQLTCT